MYSYMKKSRISKLLVLTLSMTFLVILLSGLSGAQQTELAEDQVLHYGVAASDIENLMPGYVVAGSDGLVTMAYNGLIDYRYGDMSEYVPRLSKNVPEPEMVNGKQVWTFNLRKGVMTHPFPGYPNGYELTSEDVLFSFKRMANPETSSWADSYSPMTFEAPDPYTFKVILDTPKSPSLFLPLFVNKIPGGGLVLPKKASEALGDKLTQHPVGTGPFKFEEYVPKEKIVFSKFENYWGKEPILDKIVFHFMPELGPREIALRKGDIHVTRGPRLAEWVKKANSWENTRAFSFGMGSLAMYYFNFNHPPLDSLKVRKAICYALDRDAAVELFGPEVVEKVYSQVPVGYMPGGLTKNDVEEAGFDWVYQTNIEKARSLLEEAGYPDGFKLSAFTSERADYKRMYLYLKDRLSKIGINLDVKIVDHPTYHSYIRKDRNDIVAYPADRVSADVYLTQFWHSRSAVVTGEHPITNFSHYNEVDSFIEAARKETNPTKQAELWRKANIQILEDAAGYPIFLLKNPVGIKDYVDLGFYVKGMLMDFLPITPQTKIWEH